MMPGHSKPENRLRAGPAGLAKADGRCSVRPYDYDLAPETVLHPPGSRRADAGGVGQRAGRLPARGESGLTAQTREPDAVAAYLPLGTPPDSTPTCGTIHRSWSRNRLSADHMDTLTGATARPLEGHCP